MGQVGEDIAAGQVVLRASRTLRPQDVGVLASVGVATVSVVRRPVVRLVITGDELLPPGSVPTGPRIVDSNSLMLGALVRRDGGIPVRQAIVPDRREAVEAAILDPVGDVVLVSGGSSFGVEDHAPPGERAARHADRPGRARHEEPPPKPGRGKEIGKAGRRCYTSIGRRPCGGDA